MVSAKRSFAHNAELGVNLHPVAWAPEGFRLMTRAAGKPISVTRSERLIGGLPPYSQAFKSSLRRIKTCRGSATWRGRKKRRGVKICCMPECYGGWVGDGSGTWTGSFDDSNWILLQRETNGYCVETKRLAESINTQVYGQYGLQASWDLLHGAQISWQAWIGSSEQQHAYTWYETARQVDGTNEIVTQNSVEIFKCLQKLDSLLTKADQIYTAIGNVGNLVNSCLTAISTVRDTLTAFRDEVYKRLLRAVGAVSEVVHASLLPFYRLCKSNSSQSGKFGSVTVAPDLQTHSTIPPKVTDAVASSFADDSGLFVEAWELADYGLFHPVSGSADFYYSSELRQVISRPYRNSGQVYLG